MPIVICSIRRKCALTRRRRHDRMPTWKHCGHGAVLMFPGRRMNFLLLGMPKVVIDVEKHTEMLAAQVALDPSSRANRLVTP